MPSEALRNIRTMRQVNTIADLAKSQRVETTNSLSKTGEEVTRLLSLTDRQINQVLAKERRRSAAMEAAVDKSRQRLIKAREKLSMMVNKNRALTELRHELQRARWEENSPTPTKAETQTPATPEPNLRQVELRY